MSTSKSIIEKTPLMTGRLNGAKRAFTTRRVRLKDMQTLLNGDLAPESGQLVLATVCELGKHRRIEQLNGRRALMLPGDEILVCYGNRYAPDQFEAVVSEDLGMCDLVAGGGIASREIARHERMPQPTKIQPIGLIGDAAGKPLNIHDYRVKSRNKSIPSKVILVVGTAMNAGKTFTAASLVRGLKESGHKVAGIKATGTGSGGDLWKMKDMGADLVLDFTDAGLASTYKMPDEQIESSVQTLLRYAKKRQCDYAVVEVADGLQHQETATLLQSESLKSVVSGVVFAAYDSLGAKAGNDWLTELGYRVMAISGKIAQSPLAMREAASTNRAMLTPFELQAGALVPIISGESDESHIEEIVKEMRERLTNPSHFVVDFESHLEGNLDRREFVEPRLFEDSEPLDETA